MADSNPYTFNPTENGNVEVFQNGQRISTGTADAASKYGYDVTKIQNPNNNMVGTGQFGNSLGIVSSADILQKRAADAATTSAANAMNGVAQPTPPPPTVPMTEKEKADAAVAQQRADAETAATNGAAGADATAAAERKATDLAYNADLASSNAQYDDLRTTLNNQYKTDMAYALQAVTDANPYGAVRGGSQTLQNYQNTITDKYNTQAALIEQKASVAAAQLRAGQYDAYAKTQKELDDSKATFAKDLMNTKLELQKMATQEAQFTQGEQDKSATDYRTSLTNLPQPQSLGDLPTDYSKLTGDQLNQLQGTSAYALGIKAGFTPQQILTDIQTSATSAYKKVAQDQKDQSLAIQETNSRISANKAALDNTLKEGQLLDLQIQKGQSEGFQNHPLGGDFFTALNTISPTTETKKVTSNINTLLSTGNTEGAKKALTNYVLAGEPATIRTSVSGLQDVAGYAANLKAKIAALPKTQQVGLINGKFEDIAQKFGQAPQKDLAEIAAEFGHLSLLYKAQVFGKRALTSSDPTMKALFPTISDTKDLNFATLDAMLATANDVLNSKVESAIDPTTFDHIYGTAGVLGAGTPSTTTAAAAPTDADINAYPVGKTFNYNGHNVMKTATGFNLVDTPIQ